MSQGIVYGDAAVAQDIELPWPYIDRTSVVWRNGVGMPVEFLPPNWRDMLPNRGRGTLDYDGANPDS